MFESSNNADVSSLLYANESPDGLAHPWIVRSWIAMYADVKMDINIAASGTEDSSSSSLGRNTIYLNVLKRGKVILILA